MKTLKKYKNREKSNNIKDVPLTLRKRYNKILAISIATFVVGLILMLIGFGSVLTVMLIFWLTAISALCLALKYRHDLEFKGYKVIEGQITHKKDIFSIPNITKDNSTKRPLYYHITSADNKTYRFDVTKGIEEFPLKAKIRLYCPNDVYEIENNGITILSSIWAFELISEELPVASSDENETENTIDS